MKKPAQYHDFRAKPVDNAFIDSGERSKSLNAQRTRWRKRMQLGEASIDHVTPELYKGAAKISRILRNAPEGKGHVRVGRDSVKVERFPKRPGWFGTLRNKAVRKILKHKGIDPEDFRFSDQTPEAEAWTRGANKPRSKRGKHFNLGGVVAGHPFKFKDNAVNLTHELLHIKDPGKRDDPDAVPYAKRRQERHAYGGASILGVRALKKIGVSQRLATTALKVGSMGSAAHHRLVVQPSSTALGQAVRDRTQAKNLAPHYDNFQGVDRYLQGRVGERPKRKMAKEVYKGIERVYGARNKSGGTVNKFGHVKLATPISRLPEEVSEASIDHVNPTLYKDALTIAKHYRDTPRKKGGHILDRIDRNYVGGQDIGAIYAREKKGAIPKKTFLITRANLNPLQKQHGASVLPNHQMQRERTRGIILPRAKKSTREKRHQQTIGTAVHELLHTHDFRTSIRGDQEHAKKNPSLLKSMATAAKSSVSSKQHVQYTQDQTEKLSFDATAGVHGVRMLRKGGVSRDRAKAWLRGKNKYDEPKIKGDELNYGVQHTLFRPMRDRQRTQHTSVDAKKTYRKMAKEVNKGMDRYMPAKKRELNKGKLTLASKKPKLPEAITGRFADMITEGYQQTINRYNQYGRRPQLAGPQGGDTQRRSLSPNDGIPAQKPPQQGRVQRRPTNVSEVWKSVYTLDDGIVESALAAASARAKGSSGGSMGTISNAGGTVTSTGSAGGGFGTSGGGSGRFSGTRATGGAHGGVAPAAWTGSGKGGGVGQLGGAGVGHKSAGGRSVDTSRGGGYSGNATQVNTGAGKYTGNATRVDTGGGSRTGNVTGVTPKGSAEGNNPRMSNGPPGPAGGGIRQKGGDFMAGGKRAVPRVGAGDKTHHNSRDLNPGNITQQQRVAGREALGRSSRGGGGSRGGYSARNAMDTSEANRRFSGGGRGGGGWPGGGRGGGRGGYVTWGGR